MTELNLEKLAQELGKVEGIADTVVPVYRNNDVFFIPLLQIIAGIPELDDVPEKITKDQMEGEKIFCGISAIKGTDDQEQVKIIVAGNIKDLYSQLNYEPGDDMPEEINEVDLTVENFTHFGILPDTIFDKIFIPEDAKDEVDAANKIKLICAQKMIEHMTQIQNEIDQMQSEQEDK